MIHEAERDATGYEPGALKILSDGNVYTATVMPVQAGPDEYETRIRWHRAQGRKARQFRKSTGTMLTFLALFLSLSLPNLALAQCQTLTINTGSGFKFCTQCCHGGNCQITCF